MSNDDYVIIRQIVNYDIDNIWHPYNDNGCDDNTDDCYDVRR